MTVPIEPFDGLHDAGGNAGGSVAATPPEAPPIEPVIAPKPAPRRSIAEPLLRLYLASVATFGLYLAWRVGRLATDLAIEGRPRRRHRWVWGLGVYFPPAACALLYHLPRLAREAAAAHGVRLSGRALWIAPLLYAALYLIGWFGPLGTLVAPLALFLPLPFLIVQQELNRLERVRAAATPIISPSRRWNGWLWLGALPIAGLILYRSDQQNVRKIAHFKRLDEGAVVTDPDGQFTLKVPGDGWEQVPPETLVDDGAKLGFRKRSTGAFLVTRSRSVDEKGALDEIVADRRAVLKSAGKIEKSWEKRVFLPGALFVPLSIARYTVRELGLTAVTYHVASVELGKRGIEVIAVGYAEEDDKHLGEFVASVAALAQEAGESASGEAAP